MTIYNKCLISVIYTHFAVTGQIAAESLNEFDFMSQANLHQCKLLLTLTCMYNNSNKCYRLYRGRVYISIQKNHRWYIWLD